MLTLNKDYIYLILKSEYFRLIVYKLLKGSWVKFSHGPAAVIASLFLKPLGNWEGEVNVMLKSEYCLFKVPNLYGR